MFFRQVLFIFGNVPCPCCRICFSWYLLFSLAHGFTFHYRNPRNVSLSGIKVAESVYSWDHIRISVVSYLSCVLLQMFGPPQSYRVTVFFWYDMVKGEKVCALAGNRPHTWRKIWAWTADHCKLKYVHSLLRQIFLNRGLGHMVGLVLYYSENWY